MSNSQQFSDISIYNMCCVYVFRLAAYYGLTEVCEIAGGETIVVSEADSTVGLLAVQIALLYGLNVIGMVRGAERCQWLAQQFDVHDVIDSNGSGNIGDVLEAKTPNGIDCYFDNVRESI